MFKLISKIILFVFIVVFFLEATLRIYNKVNPTFIFPNNSYSRFRGRPFTKDYDFKLNSRGFKDKEFNDDKQTGIFRILGIGDSFVFGVVPYQYNFLTLLEEGLNEDDKSFEVINMGIPYMGVEDYVALLVNEGLDLNPDLVMCCFFIGNDFAGKPRQLGETYLFSLMRYIFKIMPKYKGQIIHKQLEYYDDRPTFDTDVFLEIEKLRSWVFMKDAKIFSRQLHYAVTNIKRMHGICSHRDIKFLVILIPDVLQVDISLQSEVINRFDSLSQEYFDFTFPNTLLSQKLEELNIDYLDLCSDFINSSENIKLYKPNDTHWNISGNKLGADLILEKLVKMQYN